MATKLVIVESPAKAKTIGSYLGGDYEVQASIGHIRDLVKKAKDLPDDVRKKWWSDYGVDVDNGFEPYYEVPPEKAAQIKKLRDALKGKSELLLATDEDREGEAISWHLLQVLKPAKSVDVKRIAFHEITRDAIRQAVANPRTVDMDLVEAQETRRILDRLYGYTLSPVLWSRVTKNLSAGRVQSPAVKLIVERELARRNFRSASYWDLKAEFSSDSQTFGAELKTVDGVRVANGSDFEDETGQLRADRARKVIHLDQAAAADLAVKARDAKPYVIERLETSEGTERPAPPFMTTTLQQDANRKFGFAADRTMRVAQQLYEGIDLGGEQVGLITYMRTDSLTLSGEALAGIRSYIGAEYADCLPEKPQTYASRVKNAQEAHEAIRPTDVARRPGDVGRFLTDDQQKIYNLIWQRTVASQMKPARTLKTEAEIVVDAKGSRLAFLATGKQIVFDGFLRIYREGKEDVAEEDAERMLPRLKQGQTVDLAKLNESSHETKAPARYTDATLIKRLEELGIGRPSTYASIISVIVDRGYIRKNGRQLVPTFKAFLAMEVLEKSFQEVMDLGFTARLDEVLDEISEGKADSKTYLENFFLGEKGLKTLVDTRKSEIPYPSFVVGQLPDSGEAVIVRNGRDGDAFIQVGEEGARRYANVPEDLAPADLTLEKAIELLEQKSAPAESVGFDPATGRRLLLKFRQGYYLEVERTAEEIEAKEKPTWISLPPGVDPRTLSQDELDYLCQLPRTIGNHPETKEPISFRMGKYGPYVECGSERRTVEDWRIGQTLGIDEAVEILKTPKGRTARTATGPLQEFGELEGAAGNVRVLAGRFGPYVTDGETNATLPKGTDPAKITAEEALRLLVAKREAGPSKRPAKRTAKKPAAKPAAKSKGRAKK